MADITNMAIWGNHSPTMFPDLFNAKIGGKNAAEVVDDQDWYESDFLPTVGKRGAAIIEARGASSAASAANAADRPRPRLGRGHAGGRLGLDGGALRRLLRRRRGAHLELPVHGLGRRVRRSSRASRSTSSPQAKIDATVDELVEERDAVKKLGLI